MAAAVNRPWTSLRRTGPRHWRLEYPLPIAMIFNFVAGFDGKSNGVEDERRELDLTIDYRVKEGFLKNFSIRVRGSWLDQDLADGNGTDYRVILRYDIPNI